MADIWHYEQNGEALGPINLDQLASILLRNERPGDVLVWRQGFSDWQTASSVRELNTFFGGPPQLPVRPIPHQSNPQQKMSSGKRRKQLVRTERRRRGFFGWIILVLFIAFNALMLTWLVSYWHSVIPIASQGEELSKAGAAIGATIGTGIIISFWACGSVILGLLVLLTRGRKVITELEND